MTLLDMVPVIDTFERTAILTGVLSSALILGGAACVLAYLEERSRNRIWRERREKDWFKLD